MIFMVLLSLTLSLTISTIKVCKMIQHERRMHATYLKVAKSVQAHKREKAA